MISRAQFWRELKIASCILITFGIVSLLFATPGIILLMGLLLPAPQLTQVEVAGQVTEDGAPVAGARVVVTIEEFAGVGGRRHFYGLVSDDDGRFSMNVKAPFRYHQAAVDAAGPDDTFGSASVDDKPVAISLQPLPAELTDGSPNERFARFTGRFRFHFGDDKITFLNDPWEIRTPTDIEMGYRLEP